MSAFFLGVDGGGSKTVALVADSAGRVLGRGAAGASNYQASGAASACAAIERASSAAFAEAGIAPRQVCAICLGMAGAGRPDDRALFREWAVVQWPGALVSIVNDAELALAAGTPDGWGVALICGTGSIAYGCDRAGRAARAGGWGPLLGDEGSAYAIGLAALRAVARAADGRGPATALTGAVLDRWALADPQALIRRVYREPAAPAEIAALAALVEAAAANGDAVAHDIVGAACRELALALGAVVGDLGLDGAVPCALAGGLMINCRGVQAGVLEVAAANGLLLDPIALVVEPALGAIRLAARLRS